jgi:hypothetical protein
MPFPSETKTAVEKARDEGQIEGILFALRTVREILDEIGSGAASVTGMYGAVDAEFQEVRKRILRLQGK